MHGAHHDFSGLPNFIVFIKLKIIFEDAATIFGLCGNPSEKKKRKPQEFYETNGMSSRFVTLGAH